MSNVISFGETNPLEPNKILIEALEDILEHAKRGDIRSIVYVAVTDTDSIFTGKVLDDGANIFELIGAVQHLNYRLLREHIE